MAHRAKPHVHGRDHEHGGADPTLIHWEDVGGDGGGTGGGGIQFDTSPQVGGYLETTTTGPTGTQINATGTGDVTLNAEANDNLYATGVNIIASGDGGVIIEVQGDGDLYLRIHSPTTNLYIQGLPTSAPGGLGRVWNNGGVLHIT